MFTYGIYFMCAKTCSLFISIPIYYQISFRIGFLTLNCSIVRLNENVIWQCFHDEFFEQTNIECAHSSLLQ